MEQRWFQAVWDRFICVKLLGGFLLVFSLPRRWSGIFLWKLCVLGGKQTELTPYQIQRKTWGSSFLFSDTLFFFLILRAESDFLTTGPPTDARHFLLDNSLSYELSRFCFSSSYLQISVKFLSQEELWHLTEAEVLRRISTFRQGFKI